MPVSSNEVLLLKEQLTDLTEKFALLITSRERQQSVIRCFDCDQLGYNQHQCHVY